MFHSLVIFRRKRRTSARYELPIMLEMRGWSEGETVSTSTVMVALLWQYCGLDLCHPEVSRWLERNAPDVKYAVAEDRLASGENRSKFRIGPNGMMTVHLSLEVDDRLREVSSRYILSQVEQVMGPQAEPIEPLLVQATIEQSSAGGLSMNDYLARLL